MNYNNPFEIIADPGPQTNWNMEVFNKANSLIMLSVCGDRQADSIRPSEKQWQTCSSWLDKQEEAGSPKRNNRIFRRLRTAAFEALVLSYSASWDWRGR